MRIPQLPSKDEDGRSKYLPAEWREIKESIDCVRSGDYQSSEVQTLIFFKLWDFETSSIDEEAVHKLYMEST